jgi:hypothetical protein
MNLVIFQIASLGHHDNIRPRSLGHDLELLDLWCTVLRNGLSLSRDQGTIEYQVTLGQRGRRWDFLIPGIIHPLPRRAQGDRG